MPFSHLILCRPLFLLPPIPPSIRVFSNESTLRMRWPKIGVSALASFPPITTIYLSVLLHQVFTAERALSLVSASGIYSCCSVRASHTKALLTAEHRLWCLESVVVVLGLSCPEACGIFPDLGWKLRAPHWQVGSYPLTCILCVS